MIPVLRRLLGVMDQGRRRQIMMLVALMLAGGLAELATIGALIPFLTILASPERVMLFGISQLSTAILFAVVVSLAAAVRLTLAWATQRFVAAVAHDATVDIQRRLLHQPYPFHLAQNSSASVAALEQTQFAYSIVQQMLQAASATVLSAGIVAILLMVAPEAAIITGLILAALYLLIWRLTSGALARNSATLGGVYAERVKLVQEGAAGIRDVIVDQSQAPLLDSFRRADLRFARARARTALISTVPRIVIETMGILGIAVVALTLSDGSSGLLAALPLLGALALGAQRMLPLLQQIFQAAATFAGNRSVLSEVARLLELPLTADSGPDPAAIPFDREIRFRNVSFHYPTRTEPALQGIDLVIPKGTKVALVGPTGSGKSTLADLLMGLAVPSEGTIEIDGIALGPATVRGWQRSMAHVAQQIFLADASIATNIGLSRGDTPIEKEPVAAAAKAAQLDSFVASLPEGYDTLVSERGMALSGGQRQRVGIARAIYKDTPLLIFDEATNALDAATEQAVLGALDRLAADGKTIILIAHRESSIAHCDLVIRLDEGQVAEIRSG